MQTWPNPFIEQRADPYILRHDGQYYFIASVPAVRQAGDPPCRLAGRLTSCRRGGGLA